MKRVMLYLVVVALAAAVSFAGVAVAQVNGDATDETTAGTTAIETFDTPNTGATAGAPLKGQPVDVEGDDQVNGGDVLTVEGSYAVEGAAAVTLVDEDGTVGTLSNGENAQFEARDEALTIRVTGEPTAVTGGDGVVDTKGLTVRSSSGVRLADGSTPAPETTASAPPETTSSPRPEDDTTTQPGTTTASVPPEETAPPSLGGTTELLTTPSLEGTAPEATAPEATAPEATAPEEAAPEEAAPEEAAPEGTAPEKAEKAPVCHASGSATDPYVFLLVPTNSAHFDPAKHPDDITVGVDGPEDCPGGAEQTAPEATAPEEASPETAAQPAPQPKVEEPRPAPQPAAATPAEPAQTTTSEPTVEEPTVEEPTVEEPGETIDFGDEGKLPDTGGPALILPAAMVGAGLGILLVGCRNLRGS